MMEIKITVGIDERTATILEGLIEAVKDLAEANEKDVEEVKVEPVEEVEEVKVEPVKEEFVYYYVKDTKDFQKTPKSASLAIEDLNKAFAKGTIIELSEEEYEGRYLPDNIPNEKDVEEVEVIPKEEVIFTSARVREALVKIKYSGHQDFIKDVLNHFNVKKFDQLTQEQYPEVMKMVEDSGLDA